MHESILPSYQNQINTLNKRKKEKGRRKKEEGEEESSKKAKKECKGYTLPQAFAMLLAASITFPHFATCLVNHASDARNQYELQNAFKNNKTFLMFLIAEDRRGFAKLTESSCVPSMKCPQVRCFASDVICCNHSRLSTHRK